jgi:hypothetical protein
VANGSRSAAFKLAAGFNRNPRFYFRRRVDRFAGGVSKSDAPRAIGDERRDGDNQFTQSGLPLQATGRSNQRVAVGVNPICPNDKT